MRILWWGIYTSVTNTWYYLVTFILGYKVFARMLPILGEEEAPPLRKINDWQLGKGEFPQLDWSWSNSSMLSASLFTFWTFSPGGRKSWTDGSTESTNAVQRWCLISKLFYALVQRWCLISNPSLIKPDQRYNAWWSVTQVFSMPSCTLYASCPKTKETE